METKGITIEFYGKTIELENSLTDINKGLKATRSELNDFKKQLQIDPKNIDALKGKFEKLKQEEKLLKEQAELYRQEIAKLDKEDIGGDKWKKLDKNLKTTEKQLQGVTKEIQKMSDEDGLPKITEDAQKMGNSFKDAGNNVIKFGDLVKANVVSQAIINGIKTLTNELKQMGSELNAWAEDFREAQVYEKQFESNIKNTADATDEEIDALKKLAKQKQKEGVISSKAITSAYQELATYVESTDAIEGLTDALVDMAAQQYGVDASADSVRNLATTLGKALANGDYSGLTRLGYGFTAAQERIMKYGSEAQRVAVINDVISASIGGMNKALAQTDAGQIFQMKEWFDDTKEAIGGVVSELQISFLQEVVPEIQKFVDSVLAWVITHKDDLINTAKNVAEWLTSSEMKNFFSDVGELVSDLISILDTVIKIGDDIGLWEGIFNTVKGIVSGIKELFDSIAEDVAKIKGGGLLDWFKGNYNSYYPGAFESGGFQSGGFMSGMTINNNFTINGIEQLSYSRLMEVADVITDRVNENLGRMYA